MRPRTSLHAAPLLLSLLVSAGAPAAWQLAPVATDERGALCVAAAPDGRLAAGDGGAVWLADGDRAPRRIDLSGASRALAFAGDGALWIASENGLHRWAGARLVLREPAPGDVARDVRRVAAIGASVVAATAGGVYFSRDGVRFARVEVPVGEAGASGVALEAGAHGVVVWVTSERGLFRAAPDGRLALRAEREPLPVDLGAAVDVAADGGRIVAISAEWIVERAPGAGWTAHRLVLPPGATPIRVASGARGVWIATDRGVVSAPRADARFERAADPAGTATANDVALAGERAYVATSRGVLVGEADPAAPALAAPAIGCDPPVRAVQRAALAHLRLGGDPAAAMRRGVRVRGWLPVLTLEASKARDELRRDAYDQSYVSGGYRHLYDSDDARNRDDELALRLSWDLGDVAYHPEQIDVSTEARRLVELRDDVLDELNQLYFDRQRALAAAAALAPASPEAAAERLRAEELAAGLDAWTDGWFGPRADCAGRSASPPR